MRGDTAVAQNVCFWFSISVRTFPHSHIQLRRDSSKLMIKTSARLPLLFHTWCAPVSFSVLDFCSTILKDPVSPAHPTLASLLLGYILLLHTYIHSQETNLLLFDSGRVRCLFRLFLTRQDYIPSITKPLYLFFAHPPSTLWGMQAHIHTLTHNMGP